MKLKSYLTNPIIMQLITFFCVELMIFLPIAFADTVNPVTVVEEPSVETPPEQTSDEELSDEATSEPEPEEPVEETPTEEPADEGLIDEEPVEEESVEEPVEEIPTEEPADEGLIDEEPVEEEPVEEPVEETPTEEPTDEEPIEEEPVEETPVEEEPTDEEPIEEEPVEETAEEEPVIEENITEPLVMNISEPNVTEEIPVENISEEIIEEINITEEINLTEEPLIEENITVIEEETIQYDAVVGQPVRWKKIIKLSGKSDNLVVELPDDAFDIEIEEIEDGIEEEVEDISIMQINIYGASSSDDEDILIEDEISEKKPKKLKIKEYIKEIEIEYYTEAPQAVEEDISDYEKRVTISSDNHYEDVLANMTLPSEAPAEAVHLYHIVDGERQEIELDLYDTDGNGLIDYVEWIVPHLSEQVFELEIIILNVQSYPILGGNWEVRFTTVGQADLTITAEENTDFENVLEFIELRCGDNIVTTELTDGKIFVPDYTCNETGYEISRVLEMGKHTLKFDFGGVIAYAYNDLSMSLDSPGNNTWDTDGTVSFNCTVQINESNESITNVSLWGNWNSSTWQLITTNTTAVSNATSYQFDTSLQNGTWLWNCEGYTNNSESTFASANRTINVDSVNPVVNTLDNYGNDTWTTSQTVIFGFNATDDNTDTCVLYHNASGW
ncbi:hypothetical protein KY342_04360, partial [Candidatus Woesearchaeota archaeon]|nr:hypothetical protein [Candidatus Woesearchaeota archaeon]